MTTRPRSGSSAVVGSAKVASTTGFSRSKYRVATPRVICRARVVLPHWRGPSRFTTGLVRRASSIRFASARRGTSLVAIHAI